MLPLLMKLWTKRSPSGVPPNCFTSFSIERSLLRMIRQRSGMLMVSSLRSPRRAPGVCHRVFGSEHGDIFVRLTNQAVGGKIFFSAISRNSGAVGGIPGWEVTVDVSEVEIQRFEVAGYAAEVKFYLCEVEI